MRVEKLEFELPLHAISVAAHLDVTNGISAVQLTEQASLAGRQLGSAILRDKALAETRVEKLEKPGHVRAVQTVTILKVGGMAAIQAAIRSTFAAGVESVLLDLEENARLLSERWEVHQAQSYMDLADMLRDRPLEDRMRLTVNVYDKPAPAPSEPGK